MKVKELIELLYKLPEDMEVMAIGEDFEDVPVTDVCMTTAANGTQYVFIDTYDTQDMVDMMEEFEGSLYDECR